MQLPNVLYAREHLPQKSWISGSSMIELVEHRWNKSDRYMEGAMIPVRFGEVLDELKPIEFRQRLYTVDELREIMTSVGMEVDRVFHGSGKAASRPTSSSRSSSRATGSRLPSRRRCSRSASPYARKRSCDPGQAADDGLRSVGHEG